MNICFFTRYPPAKGIDSYLAYWLARNLGEAGQHIYVVSNCLDLEERFRVQIPAQDNSYLEPENVRLFSPTRGEDPSPEAGFTGYTDRLVSIALDLSDTIDFDLILCSNFFPPGVAGLFARLVLNRPLIIGNRGRGFQQLRENTVLRRLVTEALRRADRIEISERQMGYFQELGIPKGRMSFLEDAINPAHFSPAIEPFDLQAYTRLEVRGKPLFTCLEIPEPLSKLRTFIEAASRMEKKDFMLCFIVDHAAGMMYSKLRELVSGKGLQDRTIFLPHLPPWKLPSVINASTCIVYPGHPEDHNAQERINPLPHLREVMLCGKCSVLSAGRLQKRRWITDGLNGLVFEPGDSNQLKNILNSLVRNPRLAEDIGRHAREQAMGENEFSTILKEKIMMFANTCECFGRSRKRKS